MSETKSNQLFGEPLQEDVIEVTDIKDIPESKPVFSKWILILVDKDRIIKDLRYSSDRNFAVHKSCDRLEKANPDCVVYHERCYNSSAMKKRLEELKEQIGKPYICDHDS